MPGRGQAANRKACLPAQGIIQCGKALTHRLPIPKGAVGREGMRIVISSIVLCLALGIISYMGGDVIIDRRIPLQRHHTGKPQFVGKLRYALMDILLLIRVGDVCDIDNQGIVLTIV